MSIVAFTFFLSGPPCTGGLDIGIILDESVSVTPKHLVTAIDFLRNLVEKFQASPDQDHFGVVTFNRKAYVEFTFKAEALDSVEELKERISNINQDLAYQTRTDLALIAARDHLFSPSGGDRPDKPNVLIVLTDGKPTNQPKPFKEFAAEFHKDPKVLKIISFRLTCF